MEDLDQLLQNIVNDAAEKTNQELESELSSLTRLTDPELKSILSTGITKKDLAQVIKECKSATKSNEDKVQALQNINGGVKAVVSIVGKFL